MIATVERPAVPAGPYLVAGVGVAGTAAAEALAARLGSDGVTVWTRTVAAPFAERVAALRDQGVDVHVGGDGVSLLADHATVVKSPGIPDGEPLIAAARESVEVLDEAELGWRLDGRSWIGVTGTNGKSTVCALVASALEAAGQRPLVGGNTEGGPALTALAEQPGDVVVAELSSFQLHDAPTLLPDVAVLTNCTHDSWHRHGGREGYERDKSRIALRGETPAPHAVLPADDPLGRRLAPLVTAAGGALTTFGVDSAADVGVISCDWSLERADIEIGIGGGRVRLAPRLPGAHNALNVAAALAAGRAAGVDVSTAAEAIERAAPVPGRLEAVSMGGPFDVLVDYAHNPDGIARVLATVRHVLRRRGKGRLIAVASALPVFDDPQYEAMGRSVAAGSDRVIATTERLSAEAPQEEPPAFFGGLRTGTTELVVEIDRAKAIERAVSDAREGDVVIVLGRGRRKTPIYGADGEVCKPDDRNVARQALAARTR